MATPPGKQKSQLNFDFASYLHFILDRWDGEDEKVLMGEEKKSSLVFLRQRAGHKANSDCSKTRHLKHTIRGKTTVCTIKAIIA